MIEENKIITVKVKTDKHGKESVMCPFCMQDNIEKQCEHFFK